MISREFVPAARSDTRRPRPAESGFMTPNLPASAQPTQPAGRRSARAPVTKGDRARKAGTGRPGVQPPAPRRAAPQPVGYRQGRGAPPRGRSTPASRSCRSASARLPPCSRSSRACSASSRASSIVVVGTEPPSAQVRLTLRYDVPDPGRPQDAAAAGHAHERARRPGHPAWSRSATGPSGGLAGRPGAARTGGRRRDHRDRAAPGASDVLVLRLRGPGCRPPRARRSTSGPSCRARHRGRRRPGAARPRRPGRYRRRGGRGAAAKQSASYQEAHAHVAGLPRPAWTGPAASVSLARLTAALGQLAVAGRHPPRP